jgi:putative redox protein
MASTIDVIYRGALHCQATLAASGHTIATDAAPEHGGRGEAFSPTDLVAVAVTTCVMTVMGVIAQRNQVDLSGMAAQVEKEMAGPRIGAIRVALRIPSGGFSEAMRTKLAAAIDKCPVKRSLHPDVAVSIEIQWV